MILAEVVIISPNIFNLQSLKSCMSPHLGPRFLRKCFLTFQSMMPDVWLTQIGMTIICAVVVLRGTQEPPLGSKAFRSQRPNGSRFGGFGRWKGGLRGTPQDPQEFLVEKKKKFLSEGSKINWIGWIELSWKFSFEMILRCALLMIFTG